MIPAILGFLAALPQLIQLINSLMTWLNQVSGNDPAGFLNKVNNAFILLQNAKTAEERQAAAQAIADALAGGPNK